MKMLQVHCGDTWAIAMRIIFLCGSIEHAHGVKINRLQVPQVTQLGDSVILDCDYTLEESFDEGLVVKWFFNGRPTPIYQWIPNTVPQDSGILKGRVNLEYLASTNTDSVHRALHIIQPGPELSGNYTCQVSTFSSEDIQTKSMLVFVPERRLELREELLSNNGSLQVRCAAEGVFPRPDLTLHIGTSMANASSATAVQRAGLFDVQLTAQVAAPLVPQELACELRVPQANYTVRRTTVYYPESLTWYTNARLECASDLK